MARSHPECCPPERHPRLPEIGHGLSTLPRQLAGFPEWRAALLRDIGNHSALDGWQADAPDDLGVMLLEAWAYVLDVLSFYDARLAERAYLKTAHDERTLAEIASLIGFVPRPALSAEVSVALEARGNDPVTVPALTAFRSEAFDEEPPQVFETDAAATIWPQRNRWRVAPIRDATLQDGVLRFRAAEGPPRGSVIVISNGEEPIFAGRVRRTSARPAHDGERYQRIEFDPGDELGAVESAPLSDLSADILGLEIGLSPLVAPDPNVIDNGDGTWTLRLDSLYPRIAKDQLVALRIDNALHAGRIHSVERYNHPIEIEVEGTSAAQIVPLTEVVLAFPEDISGDRIFLYSGARPLGQPTQPAKSEITLSDIIATGELAGVTKPLGEAPESGDVIAVGAKKRGAQFSGTTTVGLPNGDGVFAPDGEASEFAEPLHTPVRLYGNVVRAIRGETVREEVLGSGDAAQAFQRFTLRRKPLSWVADPGSVLGRFPRVSVAVNGELWTWAQTLYGKGPEDRIFTVTMEHDGTAHIGFGDGKTGARLPSGVSNVLARYAFGAGAASPPAGSIKQIVRRPRGVDHVKGPLPAAGGADAQSSEEIAALAPDTALTLGKAVSLADFAAMARNFAGVLNAAASTRWDPVAHRQVIEIANIAQEGDPSAQLGAFLEARAAPGIAVNVSPATKVTVNPFTIELKTDPDFIAKLVREEVSALLFDPSNGLLSPSRITVGAPLYRSQLLAAIHGVRGVASVTAITFNDHEMAQAENPGTSAWFDLIENGSVV